MNQLKSIAVFNERAGIAKIALAVGFAIFTIALEDAFHLPVRAPGHRAFSGALALLVFAEAFTPVILIGFATVVSSILVIRGDAAPAHIIVWTATAVGIWLLDKSKTQRRILVFVAGGLLFGLLRYLSNSWGFHHTPEIIRLAGHLGFGCAGGLLSFGIASLVPSKSK